MREKICFVIMGFGKKTDYPSGRTIDLDKTYVNIIRPAVEKAGFRCIRADEIQDSGIIDKSMYALLLYSDLVIADISTYNPNAIYELGIRHAVRPYSTIILKEEQGKIPFDIDHTRIFKYKHLGEDIGKTEAERCQNSLIEKIEHVTRNSLIDSPLYEFFGEIKPPKLSEDEFTRIIGDLAEQEQFLFAIVAKANDAKRRSDFSSASMYWNKASRLAPNEDYFIQQEALCKYKSKEPSIQMALMDAINILKPLLEETNDPETLGIAGAIYKNLFRETDDVEFLERAIEHYGRGFKVRNDYYNGENYALCLNMKGQVTDDSDIEIYTRIEAQNTRKSIVGILGDAVKLEEIKDREDKHWVYATLANCYFALNDNENHQMYEQKFLNESLEDWERETYKVNLEELKNLLEV